MDETVDRESELESAINELQRQENQLFEDYIYYEVKEIDGRIERYNKKIKMNKSIYDISSFFLDSENCINMKLHNEDGYYYEIRIPVSFFEEIFEKKRDTLF